jgi:hypothetical protein
VGANALLVRQGFKSLTIHQIYVRVAAKREKLRLSCIVTAGTPDKLSALLGYCSNIGAVLCIARGTNVNLLA